MKKHQRSVSNVKSWVTSEKICKTPGHGSINCRRSQRSTLSAVEEEQESTHEIYSIEANEDNHRYKEMSSESTGDIEEYVTEEENVYPDENRTATKQVS